MQDKLPQNVVDDITAKLADTRQAAEVGTDVDDMKAKVLSAPPRLSLCLSVCLSYLRTVEPR